jgi:hypothetical protein
MLQVNNIFAEFAACFVGTVDGHGEIVFPEALDRSQLDYSANSLKRVDDYLNFLHQHQPEEMSEEWIKTVLWGGAYTGEVIRRNAPREYQWVNFEDFIQEHPDTIRLLGDQKTLGLCALLTAGEGSFILPMNKILRFIYAGPEDSVWFYANCEINEA